MKLFVWKPRYLPVEERRGVPELGARRSFGILAVQRSLRGYQALAYVPDVTTDRSYAAALAGRCNRAGLSPVHLRDFIEDTLGS